MKAVREMFVEEGGKGQGAGADEADVNLEGAVGNKK